MTAVDAAVQSKLLGAETVTIAYRRGAEAMPASAHEQAWAQTHGVLIRHWAAPEAVLAEGGQVTGVRFAATKLEGGKLVNTGDTFTLPADRVLRAIGAELCGCACRLGGSARARADCHRRGRADELCPGCGREAIAGPGGAISRSRRSSTGKWRRGRSMRRCGWGLREARHRRASRRAVPGRGAGCGGLRFAATALRCSGLWPHGKTRFVRCALCAQTVCRESDVDARGYARGPQAFRSSPPHTAPLPGTARRSTTSGGVRVEEQPLVRQRRGRVGGGAHLRSREAQEFRPARVPARINI